MALDPEQFHQRRMARQQRRQAQRKRLYLRLVLAALAIIACTVTIVLVTRPASQSGGPAASVPNTLPGETGPLPETTTIRIAAVGDVNITNRVVGSSISVRDYNDMLLDVSHLLSDPHLTLMNLEGVVSGAPYGDSRSAPEELLQALKNIGVDGVQLANSYTVHNGIASLASTISKLEENALMPLGAYKNSQKDRPYTVIEVQGIRIAIAAFTKGTVGMGMLSKGEYGTNILYTDYDTTYQEVDTEMINRVLSAMKADKPDLTIVLVHWGSEYNDNISKSQEKIRQLLQDGGVNAIIGTHSHYVQKMELSENGQFIAYSLGDFLGDGTRSGTEYSLVLHLTVEKNNTTGATRITGFDYTPTFIVNAEDQPLKVLRLREAIAAYESGQLGRVDEATYNAMKYALTRVDARVTGK